MLGFLREQQAPGGSLALAKDGKLVFARGYGIANRASGERITEASRFRIASISKCFTAAAVLQLVERGRLALDASIWALLSLPEPRDARWKRVTIQHLLQHTGGWDRERTLDPMYRSAAVARALGVLLPVRPEQVIRYMLGQPLEFAPGSREAYSNFGYCLLGRAIERASGLGYEDYVRREVLAPLGIRRAQLGRTLPADRAEGEVSYYDEKARTAPAVTGAAGASVPLPDGATYLEGMDAHAGWIATAADVARFACAFDDPAACPILSPWGVSAMFARPEGAPGRDADGAPLAIYTACSWRVRPMARLGEAYAWHNGSLAGSSALVVRGQLRTNWVVLFNTRAGPDGRLLDEAIAGPMLKTLGHLRDWPREDLFPQRLREKERK